MRFLESGDFGLLENDLERVIFRAHPEIERWKSFLRDAGGPGRPGQRFGLGGVRDLSRHGKRRGGAEEAPRHDGSPACGDLAAAGLLGPARCWGVAKR
ncbi:MAG: hypothetical protein MZU95_13110 [Desulfomicrobium escambiense]|nr:hypothetical protein [Desulfomicrobium escambiense]